jgi:hypothetical protein
MLILLFRGFNWVNYMIEFVKATGKEIRWVWKFGHYYSNIDKTCSQIMWTYSLMIFVWYIEKSVLSLYAQCRKIEFPYMDKNSITP